MEMPEHGPLKMKVMLVCRPPIPSSFLIYLDNFKICEGELNRQTSDQILLDYIPRDKQVARLKYELLVGEDEKYSMIKGDIQPTSQTETIIEFVLKLDQTERSAA